MYPISRGVTPGDLGTSSSFGSITQPKKVMLYYFGVRGETLTMSITHEYIAIISDVIYGPAFHGLKINVCGLHQQTRGGTKSPSLCITARQLLMGSRDQGMSLIHIPRVENALITDNLSRGFSFP